MAFGVSTSVKPRRVVESVTCPLCGTFFGIITSDGKGPLMDNCGAKDPLHREKCPMYKKLARFQPRRRSTRIAGRSGPADDDIGSYRTIAVRAMEDGGQ